MASRLLFSSWVLLPLIAFPASGQLPLPAQQSADTPGVQGPAPIGELFASEPGSQSAAVPAGSGLAVLSGSQLSAGIAPATLKLVRGGQVRICPRSGLTVNLGGPGLMLGMGAGAVEIDYRLDKSSADLLVTPDFSVRLAGPGQYHWAVGVTSKGDTCFKPLAGNSAGIVFAELLGLDSLGMAPNESAIFAGGKLASRMALSGDCGCPAGPPAPAMLAAAAAGAAQPTAGDPKPKETPPAALGTTSDVTAALPPDRAGATHVEVNAPFVFNARAAAEARPNAVARIEVSSLPNVYFVQEEAVPVVLVQKPAEVSAKAEDQPKVAQGPQAKKAKKGFAARVKGFFGSIFHR